MLDQNGQVVEAISSNILAVRKGEIYSPDLSKAGVQGVMISAIKVIAASL